MAKGTEYDRVGCRGGEEDSVSWNAKLQSSQSVGIRRRRTRGDLSRKQRTRLVSHWCSKHLGAEDTEYGLQEGDLP